MLSQAHNDGKNGVEKKELVLRYLFNVQLGILDSSLTLSPITQITIERII